MTNGTIATDHDDTGWGSAPPPAPNPVAPDERPRRRARWVGDTLGSTAAVSASVSWFLVGFGALAAYVLSSILSADDVVATLFAVALLFFVVLPVAVVGGVVALVTFVASIPLAVAWFRQPDRPAWPGYVLAAGVVPWTVLIGFVVVALL
jgi:hypothetical protein